MMSKKTELPAKGSLKGLVADKEKEPKERIRANESLLTGGLKAPEPYKDEETDKNNTIKIVFGTSGEYPDGTKWERGATE